MTEDLISNGLFQPGKFKGIGRWVDKKGEQGEYTTAFEIVEESDNTKAQITRREFLNADGSLLYEENSIVIVKFLENHFAEVTIRNDGKELAGRGYYFNNSVHYDLDITEDNHLENTYFFSNGKIELLGSATNKGNYTVWTETLYRVE
jgi:hypothetical protein